MEVLKGRSSKGYTKIAVVIFTLFFGIFLLGSMHLQPFRGIIPSVQASIDDEDEDPEPTPQPTPDCSEEKKAVDELEKMYKKAKEEYEKLKNQAEKAQAKLVEITPLIGEMLRELKAIKNKYNDQKAKIEESKNIIKKTRAKISKLGLSNIGFGMTQSSETDKVLVDGSLQYIIRKLKQIIEEETDKLENYNRTLQELNTRLVELRSEYSSYLLVKRKCEDIVGYFESVAPELEYGLKYGRYKLKKAIEAYNNCIKGGSNE